jgi:ubiquinone/menaquinone biosynthesis C-methylase UbiE
MDKEYILSELKKFYTGGVQQEEFPLLSHLSNEVAVRSYINRGEKVTKNSVPHARILDWGAGFGQMTFILENLGAEVTPYDVVKRKYDLFNKTKAKLVTSEAPVALPFDTETFDSVLSCGTLEHVPDIENSVKEIYRVLKTGGRFFIYNLPYKHSPSEHYADFKKISVHPIKFTKSQTAELLKKAGFSIENIGYENGIPKMFEGPLKFIKPIANKFPELFLIIDKIIINTPIIRDLLSNSITVVARKK